MSFTVLPNYAHYTISGGGTSTADSNYYPTGLVDDRYVNITGQELVHGLKIFSGVLLSGYASGINITGYNISALNTLTISGNTVVTGGPYLTRNQVSHVFNVRDYGAVGNNSTNDHDAIQRAFDDAIKFGGGTVYFPSGTYLDSGSHNDRSTTIKVLGEKNASKWRYNGNGSLLILSGGARDAIEGMYFQGPSQSSSAIAIDMVGTNPNFQLSDTFIYLFGIGLRAEDITFGNVYNSEFHTCGTGIAAGYQFDSWWINSRLNSNVIGIDIGGYIAPTRTPSLNINSVVISCVGSHNHIPIVVGGTASRHITLNDCYFEASKSGNIHIGHSNMYWGSTYDTETVVGPVYINNFHTSSNGKDCIVINKLTDLTVRGGFLDTTPSPSTFIRITGTADTSTISAYNLEAANSPYLTLSDGTQINESTFEYGKPNIYYIDNASAYHSTEPYAVDIQVKGNTSTNAFRAGRNSYTNFSSSGTGFIAGWMVRQHSNNIDVLMGQNSYLSPMMATGLPIPHSAHSGLIAGLLNSGVYSCIQKGSNYEWQPIDNSYFVLQTGLQQPSRTIVDFNSSEYQRINITGDLIVSARNYQQGRKLTLLLSGSSGNFSLNTPIGWKYLGKTPITGVQAYKPILLSLYCFGNNEEDVVADYNENTYNLHTNLISYWQFKEQSGIRYDSYYRNDLHDPLNARYATGIINSGVEFQGNVSTGQYLFNSGQNDNLYLGRNGFTWSIWARTTNMTSQKQTFFGKWNDSTNAGPRDYVLHYLGTAINRVRFNFSGTRGETGVQTSTAVSNESWAHFACVHDVEKDSLTIYRNGNLDNTVSGVGFPIASNQEFRVGGDVGGRYLSGVIDELGFWRRPLDKNEILYLYNGGTGRHYPLYNDQNSDIVYYQDINRGLLHTGRNLVLSIGVTGFTPMTGNIQFSGLGSVTVFTGVNNFIYISGTESTGVSSGSLINESFLVHTTGNEQIDGLKMFSGVKFTGEFSGINLTGYTITSNSWISTTGIKSSNSSDTHIDLNNKILTGYWGFSGGSQIDKTNFILSTGLQQPIRTIIDFNGNEYQRIGATGDLIISAFNYSQGRKINVLISGGTGNYSLVWPLGWKQLGKSPITGIEPRKQILLSAYCFGDNESDVLLNYNEYAVNYNTKLVSHWTFNEPSGIRYDSYGKNHLESVDGVDYITGVIDSGAMFQGTSNTGQYLKCSGDNDLFLGNNGFTWSLWSRITNAVTSAQVFFGKYNGATNAGPRDYVLQYLGKTTNRIRFNFSGTMGETGVQTAAGPSFGTWTHLACVHDVEKDSLSIYRNGSLDNSVSGVGFPIPSWQDFRIGGDVNGRYLSGAVDDLIFWRRPLTHEEISYVYNNGSGRKYPLSITSNDNILYYKDIQRNFIETGNKHVLSLSITGFSSITGHVSISGAGSVSVMTGLNNSILISGSFFTGDYATSQSLSETGSTLYNYVTSTSGNLDSRLQQTGSNLYNLLSSATGHINSNPSGYITSAFNYNSFIQSPIRTSINFSGTEYNQIISTGDLIISTFNQYSGRKLNLTISGTSSGHSIVWPNSWNVIGDILPTGIEPYSKINIQLYCLGNTESDILANYQVNSINTNSQLEAHWSFTEPSGIRYDAWKQHHLKNNNNVDYATGLINSGAWFQGNSATGQYLSYSGSGLFLGNNGFTWSIWATLNNATAPEQIFFGKNNASSGPRDYVLKYLGTATNRIRFNFSGTQGETGVQTSAGPAIGSWMHLVCVHDVEKDSLSMYRNGGLDNVVSGVGFPIGSHQEFRIGGDLSARYLSGVIDELSFWKRPLTHAEIRYLYNNGAGRLIPKLEPETKYLTYDDVYRKFLKTGTQEVLSISVTGFTPLTGNINISGLGTVTVFTGQNNFIYVSGASVGGPGAVDETYLVHTSGSEFVYGQKTFNNIIATGSISGNILSGNKTYTQSIYYGPQVKIDVGDSILVDDTSNSSIDWNNRLCYDSSTASVIDWNAHKLYNPFGAATVWWADSLLQTTSAVISIDWENQDLYSATDATPTINWNGREMYGRWNADSLFIRNNPVITGSGVHGYISRFNSSTGIISGSIYDLGNNKIGIGTTNLTHTITIRGTTGSEGDLGIKITNTDGADLFFGKAPGVNNRSIFNNQTQATEFRYAGNALMTIQTNSNIAVGNISSPDGYRMGIYNTYLNTSPLILTNTGVSIGSYVGLTFGQQGSTYTYGQIRGYSQASSSRGALEFLCYSGTDWTTGMRITSNGNVGIGTTTPNAKLDVSGSIASNDIYSRTGYFISSLMISGKTVATGASILDSGSAPSTSSLTVPVSINVFGGTSNLIGNPSGWLLIDVNSQILKIPFYK